MTMPLVYPGATYRPVRNHGGAMSAHLGTCMHSQQGTGSLFGWFDNPASQVSSTWWISRAGLVEQYVDALLMAWAQAAGNGTYNSIEVEGWVTEPLTEAQINAAAPLYRWGHDILELRWPFSQADTPGERGFGWHGMGGFFWGGHTGCPGDLRKNQRATILNLASGMVIPGGDQQPPLTPPATTEDPDMIIITAKDTATNATYSATFDGAHKVYIHEGPTLNAYLAAGIKQVAITIGDYNSIPNAT